MAQPRDGWIGNAFLIVNSYEGHPKLNCLPQIDKAALDFWKTFHTLRFQTTVRYNRTRQEFDSDIGAFIQRVAQDASANYVVFFFLGHGEAGDTLFLQDGSSVTVKEIDDMFSHLKSKYRILIIDACRGQGVDHEQGGHCPKYSNTILARSTLPHQVAWSEDGYGVYSRAVLKALLENGDNVVSALKTAQREIHAHCQKMGFQKVEQHTQWTESDIPTLSLEERIKSAGGWLTPSSPPPSVVALQKHMAEVIARRQGLAPHGNETEDMDTSLGTAMSSSGPPLYIGGGQSAPKSSLHVHPRQMEEPKVQATFAQALKNNSAIVDEFLDKMNAPVLVQPLVLKNLIPDRVEYDIKHSGRKDANCALLKYMKDDADEETIQRILEEASKLSNEGNMNKFAAELLRNLL